MKQGTTHDPFTRLAMSRAARRRHTPISVETRAKIAAAHLGMKHDEATRRKMSASHKGVPLPDAVKAKLADGRKAGANHWNWAGGKSEDKHANSKRYYTWKLAVHKRDMNICVDCGKTDLRGRDRQADHIEPWSENRARRFDVSNGRTLCHPCHAKRSAQQSRERNQRRKAA